MNTTQTWKIGDCLKLLPEIPDKSIDLVLTDLPYGTTECKWDEIIPLKLLWKQYDRIIKDNAVVVLTTSQPFTSLLVMSNIKAFRHEWIWIKNQGSNFANTIREPMKEHESVLVFSKNGKWTYNRQMQERMGGGIDRAKYLVKFNNQNREGTRKFEGREHHTQNLLRVPSSWQKFNREVGLHPAQKPLELFEYLIKTYTNEGDMVHDSCLGSGTTLEACKKLNRNCIGFEIDPQWEPIYRERLDRQTFAKSRPITVSGVL